jgi:hypothetical protein
MDTIFNEVCVLVTVAFALTLVPGLKRPELSLLSRRDQGTALLVFLVLGLVEEVTVSRAGLLNERIVAACAAGLVAEPWVGLGVVEDTTQRGHPGSGHNKNLAYPPAFAGLSPEPPLAILTSSKNLIYRRLWALDQMLAARSHRDWTPSCASLLQASDKYVRQRRPASG